MDELVIQNSQGEIKFISKDGKDFAIIDGKEVPLEELYNNKESDQLHDKDSSE